MKSPNKVRQEVKSLADTHAVLAVEYIRRFGLVGGARIMMQMNSGQSSVNMRVPGYEHPILLRPNTSDIPVFTQVFVKRFYEFEYPVSDPKLIVDAGANVGYATIYYANRYPNARIIAIEPEPSNYDALTSNLQRYPNTEPIRCALWNQSGRGSFVNPQSQKWGMRVESVSDKCQHEEGIRLVTVNDILSGSDSVIDIFKIDIEGAERQLFAIDSQQWIDRVRMFVIELHDSIKPGCASSFYRALGDRPYRWSYHGESVFVQML